MGVENSAGDLQTMPNIFLWYSKKKKKVWRKWSRFCHMLSILCGASSYSANYVMGWLYKLMYLGLNSDIKSYFWIENQK